MLEAILGREPINAGLFGPGPGTGTGTAAGGFPVALVEPLLYFAAAKSDVQAVRVMAAVSGASGTAVVRHGAGETLPAGLAAALAKLMTPPSIRQQLRLVGMISGGANAAAADKAAFLEAARARFATRIDGDAVNDTAVHVAAFGYDHETVLALLVRDGGGRHVDTPDSRGRTVTSSFPLLPPPPWLGR